jgi:acylphosphatase
MAVVHLNLEIYRKGKDPFFKRSIRHRAHAHNLKGYVDSSPDGSLMVELEGEEKEINKFLVAYQDGEESEEVIRLETTLTEEFQGYTEFEIRGEDK